MSNTLIEDRLFTTVPRGARFNGATLRRVRFQNCTLEDVSFEHASFSDCTFRDATLVRIDFRYAQIMTTTFRDAVLDHCDLYRTVCSSGVVFEAAQFFWCSLHNADLRGSTIQRTNLRTRLPHESEEELRKIHSSLRAHEVDIDQRVPLERE